MREFQKEVSTARLTLTPLVAEDADELFPLLDDDRLHRFIGGVPPTREYLRARFARWEARASPDGDELWLNWVVRLAADGTAIGYVQATVVEEQAHLAYVIGTAWSGQGLATEAVAGMIDALRDLLPLTSISAHIHPEHAASGAVARKVGLVATGQIDEDGEEVWITAMEQ